MKLIFERSVPGRRCSILPACDVEETPLPESLRRAEALVLPELSEQDLSRHYTELNHHVHGVNCGFYPLGSCTMKYNPRINEEMAALPGFTGIHPLAPAHTVQGCRRVLELAQQYLCEITGMDGMTFQPAARCARRIHGRAAHQAVSRCPWRQEAHEDHRSGFRAWHEPGYSCHVRLSGREYPVRAERLRRS